MGAHGVTVAVAGGGRSLEVFLVESIHAGLVGHRAHFHQLAVEVEDARRSGALVEVVDVLRNHVGIIPFLKFNEPQMGGVGAAGEQLSAPVIVN